MKIKAWTIFLPLLFGIVLGLWLQSKCKPDKFEVPDGYILVTERFIDSLQAIADLPPEVDTVWLKGDTVWLEKPDIPVPEPDPEDTTVNVYVDSLNVWNQISAGVRIHTTGVLTKPVQWWYTPVIQKVTIEKPAPYPVIEKVEIDRWRSGFYLSGVLSGNMNTFIPGVDFDLVSKNNNIYGLQYRWYGGENIIGVKVGIKLNNLFKRK